jgi:hypothetical protein
MRVDPMSARQCHGMPFQLVDAEELRAQQLILRLVRRGTSPIGRKARP